jgi:DNA-binding IscR family transcriptional regulator
MKCDSRLSSVLHVLLHLADAPAPLTSEALARYLDTNAVVVRRVLAGLRDAGLVASAKGHGGGWTLTRGIDAISLRDVYDAVGQPTLFSLGHRRPDPRCAIERVVNGAIDGAVRDAETRLLERFAGVRLADLARELPRHSDPLPRTPRHDH